MIKKKCIARGGVFIPNADVHRRGGANRWTCADMGKGGVKNHEKTADVLCEWPLLRKADFGCVSYQRE